LKRDIGGSMPGSPEPRGGPGHFAGFIYGPGFGNEGERHRFGNVDGDMRAGGAFEALMVGGNRIDAGFDGDKTRHAIGGGNLRARRMHGRRRLYY